MNTLIIAMLAANHSPEFHEFDLIVRDGKFAERYVALQPWETKLLRSQPALTVVDDHGPVLDETPEYVVTPANGVWDVEYGKRNDHALYWKGNPARPYRDESAFGTIVFKGK